MRDGWFRWHQRSTTSVINNPIGVGVYEGTGDRVVFHLQEPYFNAIDISELSWHLQGSSIVFDMERCTGPARTDAPLCGSERALFTAHPWVLLPAAGEA
jgi:hypothetical protein